jgi:hypothetical protein
VQVRVLSSTVPWSNWRPGVELEPKDDGAQTEREGTTSNLGTRKRRGVSMQSELIVFLGEVNREIRGLVCKLSDNRAEAKNAALSSSELKALAQKLAQVAKLLDLVPPPQPKEDALQAVISEYVDNLEKLKGVLARVQDSLGKQRDRLKKDFEHLNSARAWVETFRATH